MSTPSASPSLVETPRSPHGGPQRLSAALPALRPDDFQRTRDSRRLMIDGRREYPAFYRHNLPMTPEAMVRCRTASACQAKQSPMSNAFANTRPFIGTTSQFRPLVTDAIRLESVCRVLQNNLPAEIAVKRLNFVAFCL